MRTFENQTRIVVRKLSVILCLEFEQITRRNKYEKSYCFFCLIKIRSIVFMHFLITKKSKVYINHTPSCYDVTLCFIQNTVLYYRFCD